MTKTIEGRGEAVVENGTEIEADEPLMAAPADLTLPYEIQTLLAQFQGEVRKAAAVLHLEYPDYPLFTRYVLVAHVEATLEHIEPYLEKGSMPLGEDPQVDIHAGWADYCDMLQAEGVIDEEGRIVVDENVVVKKDDDDDDDGEADEDEGEAEDDE